MKYAITFLISFSAMANGRFELHMNQKFPAQSLLLDTQTGKVWRQTCYFESASGECTLKAWAPEKVVDLNIKLDDMYKIADKLEKEKSGK